MSPVVESAIQKINLYLDIYSRRRCPGSHDPNCECFVCNHLCANEFQVTRFGECSLSDEIFFTDSADLMIHEIIKSMRRIISDNLFGLTLHYRVRKTIYGIKYEFFRVFER